MSLNLIADALANDRSLPQIIEGAVIRTEIGRKASLTHTMDKVLYEAFVQFTMRTEEENKVKFLFDVCQYRHLCKLAHGWSEVPKKSQEKKGASGTSDRRFQMLFCIVAEYIMPKGIKEIEVPRSIRKKLIGEVCEYLNMGTVRHLEGMPSLGRFFELRYEQLRTCKPQSKIIQDISMRIFGDLDEPKVNQKKISATLFDELVCHFSDRLQELYEEFRNTLLDVNNNP